MERSESIKNLAMALVKFHSMVGKIKKDTTNPFFKSKYADLSDIQDEIQGPLNESGLVISQLPMGHNELTTMLIHADSGEYIMGTYTMVPVKNDPQSVGSCITYQKRYALSAILNLNLDSDDDGNAASKNNAPTPDSKGSTKGVTEPKSDVKPNPEITIKMFNQLIQRLKLGENDVITKAKEMYSFDKAKGELVNSIMKAKKEGGVWKSEMSTMNQKEFESLIKMFREGGNPVMVNASKFFTFTEEQTAYVNKVIESINKKAA